VSGGAEARIGEHEEMKGEQDQRDGQGLAEEGARVGPHQAAEGQEQSSDEAGRDSPRHAVQSEEEHEHCRGDDGAVQERHIEADGVDFRRLRGSAIGELDDALVDVVAQRCLEGGPPQGVGEPVEGYAENRLEGAEDRVVAAVAARADPEARPVLELLVNRERAALRQALADPEHDFGVG